MSAPSRKLIPTRVPLEYFKFSLYIAVPIVVTYMVTSQKSYEWIKRHYPFIKDPEGADDFNVPVSFSDIKRKEKRRKE